MDDSKKGLLAIVAGIIILLITIWAFTLQSQRGAATSTQREQVLADLQRRADAQFSAQTPEQHRDAALSAAQKHHWVLAEKHVNAIPPGTLQKDATETVSIAKAAFEKAQKQQKRAQELAELAARKQARLQYANKLEGHLLSLGIDARVRVVGDDTLRVSWAAMSRPVVYNMMNSSGMQAEVPSLGFRRVILTDDGSFSGLSRETWRYRWTSSGWSAE